MKYFEYHSGLGLPKKKALKMTAHGLGPYDISATGGRFSGTIILPQLRLLNLCPGYSGAVRLPDKHRARALLYLLPLSSRKERLLETLH